MSRDNAKLCYNQEDHNKGKNKVNISVNNTSFLVPHTLQDFYSHSNWVELGNVEPFSNLLRADLPLENLAGVGLLCTVQGLLLWDEQNVVNFTRHI